MSTVVVPISARAYGGTAAGSVSASPAGGRGDRGRMVSMRGVRLRVAAAAAVAVAMVVAQMTLAGGVVGSGGVNFGDFRSVSFSNPTRITNRWFPLAPGTEFV